MEILKDILKKSLPAAVAVLLFGTVALIGFKPQLDGKVLPQGDISQFNGMSRDIRECREQFGEDPQWTGAMFSGMPAYQINIKYPSQFIKSSVDWVQSLFAEPASMIFFAMLAAFIMAVMMGMSAWVGVIVGLAYGLSTYFFLIIGAGHITKMWALVYAPAMLGAIHYTLRKNMWLGGGLTALFAALEIGANHPQITYYFLFAAIALFISEAVFAIKEKRYKDFAKRTAILFGAAVLSIGANFAPLYYTLQHSSDTTRGGSALEVEGERKGLDLEYATAWSYGIDESLNMLVPNLMGGDSGNTFSKDGEVSGAFKDLGADKYTAEMYAQQLPTYWGEQPYTAGPTYLGAIVIFLALLGLLLAENRDRWWILATSILAILMAWGYHAMWFTELCFDYLPLYDKFRAVSTALVVVEWSAPLLAGIGLWQIYKRWEDRKALMRAIAIAGGIVSLLCLILIATGSNLFDFNQEESIAMMSQAFGGDEDAGYAVGKAMAAERASMLADDAVRSLTFVLLAAGVLLGVLFIKSKKNWHILATIGVLAILIIVDILPVNLRYVPYEMFIPKRNSKIMPTQANKDIMADKELGYRVLNVSVSTFNDAKTSMFHRSIGGYHGAKMGRYQDVIDRYLNQNDSSKLAVLDMLNTKYIILSNEEFVENPTRNGAAWFVKSVEKRESADEALKALGEVNLKEVAVVEESAPQPAIKGEGSIDLVEYRPNYLRYDYILAGGDAVAVFSEIYYDKGWQAYIDGKPADSFRANYILRGMVLPEGKHSVEWRFKAPNWNLTSTITLICSILIIFALIISIIFKYYEYRSKKIVA
ncbi:MAG: hypothetical protein IIV16_00135 [Alistipes sp.]|nr:hypothetical protein [Alistipes sp.]